MSIFSKMILELGIFYKDTEEGGRFWFRRVFRGSV